MSNSGSGDLCSSLGSKFIEEAVEATCAFALCPVDDLATFVVGDQGQVVVMFSVRDLIHSYQKEVLQAFGIELFSHYPLTNHSHGSPQ